MDGPQRLKLDMVLIKKTRISTQFLRQDGRHVMADASFQVPSGNRMSMLITMVRRRAILVRDARMRGGMQRRLHHEDT
jgi:hypothetical protein